MTRDEMNHFARGIGRIISSEVHDPSARDRMNSEIKRLVAQFQADVHPLT
jgi:hypothetical protein